MTLVSEIIRQALRETNVISRVATATAEENAEGLSRLQALVLSSLGSEAGYIMEDWSVVSGTNLTKPSGVPLSASQAAAYTVPPNARLVCGLTAATALLLDPQPQDGQRVAVVDAKSTFNTFNLTINPNGRKIGGSNANQVIATGGIVKEWLYRGDLADWKVITPLLAGDEFTFPQDFDDYFIISLAMRLNPRYGKQLSAASTSRLEQQRAQFIYRYAQNRLIAGSAAPQPGQ